MYNFGKVLFLIGSYVCGPVSSGLWTEAISRTLLRNSEVLVRASLPWLMPKREHSMVKDLEREVSRAYSRAVTVHFRKGEDYDCSDQLEPYSLTATYLIKMKKVDSRKIISDDELEKNLKLTKTGEINDETCKECNMYLVFHPHYKKHYCDILKITKEWNDVELDEVQLDLSRRLNGLVLSNAMEEKKAQENDFASLMLKNMNMLTDKIEKIASPSHNTSSVNRNQVVARRNCPSWTAGTSIEVFRRWVEDWNANDKSDELVKYMDITRNLSENKVIPGLKEYMKKIVIPSLSITNEEKVKEVLNKLEEKYKRNKFEKFDDTIQMMEDFHVKEGEDNQVVWEKFIHLMEKLKSIKVKENIDYLFLVWFLKKGRKVKLFSSYEEDALRNKLGEEEECQPNEVLKSFGTEFTRLKIQNHREFEFEKGEIDSEVKLVRNEKEEDVHFNERGRQFQRNSSKFVRSKSNPRFYRSARSQSWNNARSQSRSRPNQRFDKVQGTRYWNNREEEGKSYMKNDTKLDEILKSVKRVVENWDELNKRVGNIEEKIKKVNYCEEEIREVHFLESDKVDYEMIIDSGCPKTLASEKIVESYIEKHGLKRKDLGKRECAMMFKFGNSRYPSHETLKIPVKLPIKGVDGERDSFFAMIETYVVKVMYLTFWETILWQIGNPKLMYTRELWKFTNIKMKMENQYF